jgi:hypothetical protein
MSEKNRFNFTVSRLDALEIPEHPLRRSFQRLVINFAVKKRKKLTHYTR